MERTIIIGDIHGCLEETRILLDKCGYTTGERVIFVGDLVSRGPDPIGTLELIREIHAQSVVGNQDRALLDYRNALINGQQKPAISQSNLKVAIQLEERDWQFLSSLPLFIQIPEFNCLVVHAGMVPGIPLQKQKPELLLNIRTIRPDGSGSIKDTDGVPWGRIWQGPQEVIFGHHAKRGIQRYPYATGLDSGCVYGGRLTAYILPERKLVSVPAFHAYYPV